jgi:hypothetical protein
MAGAGPMAGAEPMEGALSDAAPTTKAEPEALLKLADYEQMSIAELETLECEMGR